jgi:hypothetical protein
MTYPYTKFKSNLCNPYRDNERKLKISIFFLFKRDNSVKNQWTITKFELDLHISMINLHMQFESYTCIQTKVRERKLKISIFSKFKRDNSFKNQWTITKFELDLCIPMTYIHMQIWTLYIHIQTKVREGKLKIFSRGITLSKNHQTMTKFEIDLHNSNMYPYTKFELNVCNHFRDNEWKPMIMEWRNDEG